MNKTKEIIRKNVLLTFNQPNSVLFKYISHSKPIDKTVTADFQRLIYEYMAFNRKNISHKIFHHSIDRWGFGMGLHGEQGVELVHSSIKKLKNQIHT